MNKEAHIPPDKKYLVTAYPPKNLKTGEKNQVLIQFFDAATKKPAEGIVTINDRLYEVKKGLVKVELVPEEGEIKFKIAW